MQIEDKVILAFIFLGLVQLVYILYKTRSERLKQREKKVNEQIEFGIFENRSRTTADGFIFCSVWRLSHIRKRADQLGYVFHLIDIFAIISIIKRDFDPLNGISQFTIDSTIHNYVRDQKIKMIVDSMDDLENEFDPI